MGKLNDFYYGTTKKFNVAITYNGSSVDISADNVAFIMKTDRTLPDGSAAISMTADVATSGAGGTAIFNIPAGSTAVTVGQYWYDIKWRTNPGSEVYIVDSNTVNVLQRTFQ
jgi:hypothetical protein